jgi:hypothetical protein
VESSLVHIIFCVLSFASGFNWKLNETNSNAEVKVEGFMVD